MTWCRSAAHIVRRVQCTPTLTEPVCVCLCVAGVCGPQRAALVVFAMLPTWCGMLFVRPSLCTQFVGCFECLSRTLACLSGFFATTPQKNIENLIQTRNCGHQTPASLLQECWDFVMGAVAMETSPCEDGEIIVWILFAESAEFYLVWFTFQLMLISLQQFYVKTGRTKLLDLLTVLAGWSNSVWLQACD